MPSSLTSFISGPSSYDSFATAMSSPSDPRSINDLRRDIDYGKNRLKQLDAMSQEYNGVVQGITNDSKLLQAKHMSRQNPSTNAAVPAHSSPDNAFAAYNATPGFCMRSPPMSRQPVNIFDNNPHTSIYPSWPFGQYGNQGPTAPAGSTNGLLQDPSEELFVAQSPATETMSTGLLHFSPLPHRPVNSKKRPQHRLSNFWDEEQVSKRPSPSPAMLSGPSDPHPFPEVFDQAELMQFLDMTSKEEFEEYLQAAKEAEKQFGEAKEQERESEQWARKYQPIPSDSPRPSSSTSAGPSGYPGLYTPQTHPSASSQTSVGSSLTNRSSAPYHVKQAADAHNPGSLLTASERKQRPAAISPFGNAEIIDLVDSDDDGGNLVALMNPRHDHKRFTAEHESSFSNGGQPYIDLDAAGDNPQFGHQPAAFDQVQGVGGTGVYNSTPAYGASDGQEAHTFLQKASQQVFVNQHAHANGLPGSFDSPLLVDGMDPLAHMTPGQRAMFRDHYKDMTPEQQAMYGTGLDPISTAQQINSLLANIRPDEDIPPQQRTGTPESMSRSSTLYEHQKLGLAWMVAQEEGSNKGGILADDMGLGKTVQALALMASRRSNNPQCKTNLIIAPVTLLKQWEREISVRLRPEPEHRLKTFIYHGSTIKTPYDALKQYDVVLTTYGTLNSELKRKNKQDDNLNANPNWRPGIGDVLPLLGRSSKWYRVILDEAQNIKNKATGAAQATYLLQAQYRYCLTGTPMMNDIKELFSLIHFLRIKPYNVSEKFTATFVAPLKGSSRTAKDTAMGRLRALLKAILLRRTKKSVIDGKPIIVLPERTTEIVHTAFSADEDVFYKSLEMQTRLEFNKYVRAGTVGKNYSNVLVLLLRLRQACCHPHLIKNHTEPGAMADASPETAIAKAQELSPDVVRRIIDQGALECPICMDTAENTIIFIPCGHSTCSECYARISDPSQSEREGGTNTGFKCPNDRSVITFGSVTDYSSFKKVHMPEPDDEASAIDLPGFGQNEDADADATDSDSETDSEDGSDEGSDLDGFIVSDDIDPDATASEDEDADDSKSAANKRKAKASKTASKKASKKAKKTKRKGKAKDAAKVSFRKKSLAELKKESLKSAKARRYYLKRLAKEWITSAKIEKVLEILRAVAARGKEKTIIFSQFTSLLDLLEVPISREDWGYRRFDGSMSSVQRNNAVLEFSDDPNVHILLVSLKAGNAGLNLTAASQVILFDPFWNPYIEEQAIDRAHRIGQRLPVQVHRVLVPQTVEDRIIALQEKKRAVIEGALDEKAAREVGRLGTRELAYLFGVTGNQ